ncbi:Hypothetical protein A7982_03121 [Minicystis rosea]|nr:Hypothetical protein A7982_03121 [Minicystis rosea]
MVSAAIACPTRPLHVARHAPIEPESRSHTLPERARLTCASALRI